jgi:hypothetical protein
MRRALAILSALALLYPMSLSSSTAGPEPGTDERRAGMCDAFAGVAFTFCVALCEARACDLQPAGDARCALIARGFARVTAGTRPPCAGPAFGGRAL